MKTIYDYIVFTDDKSDNGQGNHVVERKNFLDSQRIHQGKPVLSFRVNIPKQEVILYFDSRIRFTSDNLEEVKEFAILDNL